MASRWHLVNTEQHVQNTRVICFIDCTIKDTKLRKEEEEEKEREKES
jgi:hypothetical protein